MQVNWLDTSKILVAQKRKEVMNYRLSSKLAIFLILLPSIMRRCCDSTQTYRNKASPTKDISQPPSVPSTYWFVTPRIQSHGPPSVAENAESVVYQAVKITVQLSCRTTKVLNDLSRWSRSQLERVIKQRSVRALKVRVVLGGQATRGGRMIGRARARA